MRHKQILFRDNSGSVDIHAQLWLPDREPRLLLQVVHGINEYGGRYADFAHFLCQREIGLAVHDQLGHGLTAASLGPDRLGYFAPEQGWRNAIADIRHFSARLRDRFPGLPLVLLGHSMGSFMTRCLLIDFDDTYAAVILSGTGCNNRLSYLVAELACRLELLRLGPEGRSKLLQGLALGSYIRRFAEEKHPAAWITSDRQEYHRYGKDPWCRFLPSIRMYQEMFRGMRYMDRAANYRRLPQDLPLLLVSGKDDPVGGCGRGVSAVYRRLEQAGVADVELLLYPGGRHEMLHEVNKDQVYQDIFQWMTEKCL